MFSSVFSSAEFLRDEVKFLADSSWLSPSFSGNQGGAVGLAGEIVVFALNSSFKRGPYVRG